MSNKPHQPPSKISAPATLHSEEVPRSHAPSRPSWGRRWLGRIGSLKLAVVVLTLYAMTVGWATLVDNRYGATAVAWGIYRSTWFATLNVVLGINVLGSVLARFPWKKRHIGFLMTHTGILLIMIGSSVTWRSGVDGVMGVFEGRNASSIVTDERVLELSIDGKTRTIPLAPGPFSWAMLRNEGTDGSELSRFPWRLCGNGKPQTIYVDESVHIEMVDWMAQVRLIPLNTETKNASTSPRWTYPTPSPEPLEVTIQPVPFPGRDATRADREAWVDRGLRAAQLKISHFVRGGSTSVSPPTTCWLLLDESESARFRRMAGEILTPETLTDAEDFERVRYAETLTPEMSRFTEVFGADVKTVVTLSLRSRNRDAGFGVTLHEFERRFNPGSQQASYYASVVDLTKPDGTVVQKDQRITMNEPIEFQGTRLFQTSWRGPWTPGHPFYDTIEPVESEATQLYMTVLSANRDPGSGWKYVGSLLLLAGMTIVFVQKTRFRTERMVKPMEKALDAASKTSTIIFAICVAALSGFSMAGISNPSCATAAEMDATVESAKETVDPTKETVESTKETVESTNGTAEPANGTAETVSETAESVKETADPTKETAESANWESTETPFMGAETDTVVDWNAWGQLPVLSRGRIRPLDTVARQWADEVTDRERPLVSPPDGETPQAKLAAKLLFPDGKTRRFMAGEILFGWMAAPELWREIPLLRASHEELRNYLELPLHDDHGGRYRLTTLAQLSANPKYQQWLGTLGGTTPDDGTTPGVGGPTSPRVRTLLETLYSHAGMVYQFGLDPSQPLPIADYQRDRTYHQYRSHDRFLTGLTQTISAWRGLAANPLAREILEIPMGPSSSENREASENNKAGEDGGDGKNEDREPQTAWSVTGIAVMKLHRWTISPEEASRYGLSTPEPDAVLSIREIDESLAILESVANQMADRLTGARTAFFATGYETETSQHSADSEESSTRPKLTDAQLKELRTTAYEFRSLARRATESRYALTMVAPGPAIVPSLELSPLDPRRPEEETIPVWLDLRTVLCGSESLLADYPQQEMAAVREAWRMAVDDYRTDRSDRDARFARSLARVVESIRTFGEAVSTKRDARIRACTAADSSERTAVDGELVLATRYPTQSATRLEFFYNGLRPFMVTWATALASMIFFGVVRMVPLPRVRRLAFLGGSGFLLLSILFCLCGFTLRTLISHRAPVATLFETLIFVGLVAAILGFGLTFRVLTERGWRIAWLRTMSPWRREVRDAIAAGRLGAIGVWGWWFLRILIGVGIFILLSVVPYGESGRSILSLLPAGTSVGRLIAWNVGLILLVATVWFGPRLLVAAIVSIGTITWDLFHRPISEMIEATYKRQIAAAMGAIFAFVTTFLAYWFPETFSPSMDRLMPVLGDQFWLASHVLTITASYGAGAIGWGLGNIALGYYLFGTYTPENAARQIAFRPPEICQTLAGYNYFAILIAVCLLTLGTILGALWADVSWGRFWAWDQKEVWSLVTIFVYMVILHGRYTGWLGNFGMAAGATIGAASILMAWFGVSFLLPGGLHSYASLDSQSMQRPLIVAIVVLLVNLSLVFAAGWRLRSERSR